MKRYLALCIAALCLLLSGCASVIRSDVIAFNEWPANLPDKSFSFIHTAEQENDLEYRSYEAQVSHALQQLGFTQSVNAKATLNVTLSYGVRARDVHTIEPVEIDPGIYGSPFYASGLGYRGFYGPLNGPFWYAPPIVVQREFNYLVFTRHMNVRIARTGDGKKLYDVTVVSEGRISSLPMVMPYLIQSAFSDFPGKSGVPRQVKLKIRNDQ
ncbi:DUF4136 domain-containing protein [Glaciimonas immobilis]|uniref:DUF4136 domain-containing protein n=1 Tax=Glaciimonas immobilis TaxID=728004 RepID=A0A840RQ11_9BURK|nr:DUF4136 domain-containing protein [Glaciimonas immobilis]KAF3999974.1 DUF4136 domain-containing protein [Glaciimonas immobilis]MBB5200477.1 hypothetical protein [Glaciimonas immobilis]